MSEEIVSKPFFLTHLLGVLLRLIFVFVVGIFLGAGLYFGFQAFYNQFVRPVQEHALRLDALELQQQQIDQNQTRRLESLISRMETIEIQSDEIKESLSIIDNRIDRIQAYQATQDSTVQALDRQLEVQAAAIAVAEQTLRDQVEQIQSNRSASLAELEDVYSMLQAVQTQAAIAEKAVLENGWAFSALQAQVEQQIQLLTAMELLTRARLNLAQGNLSLARADIEAAHAIVLEIREGAASDQAAYFEKALTHLDHSGEFLPLEPVRASDELEGAWQLLQESLLLKPEIPLLTRTPAAATTRTPTPTP
jgi:hypothetical protein